MLNSSRQPVANRDDSSPLMPLAGTPLNLPSADTFLCVDKTDTRPRSPTLDPKNKVDDLANAIDAIELAAKTGGVLTRSVDRATPQLIEIADVRGKDKKLLDAPTATRALDVLHLIATTYPDEAYGKEALEAIQRIAKDKDSKVADHAKKLLEKKD